MKHLITFLVVAGLVALGVWLLGPWVLALVPVLGGALVKTREEAVTDAQKKVMDMRPADVVAGLEPVTRARIDSAESAGIQAGVDAGLKAGLEALHGSGSPGSNQGGQ